MDFVLKWSLDFILSLCVSRVTSSGTGYPEQRKVSLLFCVARTVSLKPATQIACSRRPKNVNEAAGSR